MSKRRSIRSSESADASLGPPVEKEDTDLDERISTMEFLPFFNLFYILISYFFFLFKSPRFRSCHVFCG